MKSKRFRVRFRVYLKHPISAMEDSKWKRIFEEIGQTHVDGQGECYDRHNLSLSEAVEVAKDVWQQKNQDYSDSISEIFVKIEEEEH